MTWITKRSNRPGWMAISLHPDRIDFAHVERPAGRRPLVTLLESYRREGDDAAALDNLRRKLALGKYRCSTLLGRGDYQVVQVETPAVQAAETRDALRWRLKDLISIPVETATVDAIAIPAGAAGAGRPRLMFAVAAANSVIQSRQALFEAARVPLEVVDIPELAQRNVAALYGEGPRAVAMLVIDAGGGLLTFTADGELCAFRNIELTLPQIAAADHERRYEYFERIGLELQRSLDNFDRQFSHAPLAKLLVAPTPEVPGLLEYLAGNLYLPTEAFDLAAVLDFPDVPELQDPARQLQCLPTLGAALRDSAGTP